MGKVRFVRQALMDAAPLVNQDLAAQPARKILMVAYLFPPAGGIGAAGSQRVLKFAKYLPDYHWQPVILTVKESHYEPYLSLDRTLLEKVPPETKIIKTTVIRWFTRLLELQKIVKTHLFRRESVSTGSGSLLSIPTQFAKQGLYQRFKNTMTDLFEIPDEEMGWFLPGVFTGLRAIKEESIDVIYSTGRPWTAHLIGLMLKLLTRKPLIVDFRDPWLTNPFRAQYSALRNSLETLLERQVIEKADIVIANTQELQEEFLGRFPEQPQTKFIALLNGFDSDDFTFEVTSTNGKSAPCFTMTHTGFLYGKRDPQVFLKAVRRLLDEQRFDRQSIRISFVGSIELPYDLPGYLSANGLSDIVMIRDHVPYQQSLEYLWKSDALLLLQPGTKTQIPSKLFEYIGMRKPIIAISPPDGATARLINSERLGIVLSPDDIPGISHAIYDLYQASVHGSLSSVINPEAHNKFDAKNVAARLATICSQLAARDSLQKCGAQ
jgi:glycosyltransferase involved in cell wall biosynthesis